MTEKWHMNRLGLVDFWYYDYQEFFFKEGHMMLRGGNGSGKSVTMQSFLPLILDGNKSSSRLDPFGSRDRKMEDYLYDEARGDEPRIGYLFLEFKRKDLEIYKTIGMGMRYRKNSNLSTWYFVIEDNKRIGQDIDLFPRKLAITKQILKSIIGNQLIETQGEYRRRVNDALFGFETEQEYKEVLDLIIQLRSPKLSNSLKPTTLNEILNNALQPLSEDDLRPMTEAIENMDKIKDQVMMLEENVKATKQIISVYDQYNHRVLLDKIDNFLSVETETRNTNKAIQDMITELKNTHDKKVALDEENKKINLEILKLQDEKGSLLREDVESLVLQMNKDKEDVKEIKQNITKKEAQLEDKETKRIQTTSERKIKKDEVDMKKDTIKKSFDILDTLQEQLQFEEHLVLQMEFINNLKAPFNANYTNKRLESETELINQGLERFKKLYKLEAEYQSHLELLEKTTAEKETLESDLDKETKNIKTLIDASIVSFYNWNKENETLKLETDQLEDIALQLKNLESQDTSSHLNNIINTAYLKYNRRYNQEEEKYAHNIKVFRETKDTLSKELNHWVNLEDPTLPIDESTEKNRTLLKDKNIPHLSFYEMLEFEETLDEKLKGEIEEKLRRTSLLGAQIISKDDFNKVKEVNHETSDYYLITHKEIKDITSFIITQDFINQNDWNILFNHFGIEDTKLNNINTHTIYNGLYSVITTTESPRFIGKKAREKYKETQIQILTQEIEDVDESIKEVLNQIQVLDNHKAKLEREYESVPKVNFITEKRHTIQMIQSKLYEKIKDIEDKRKAVQEILDKKHEDRTFISNLSHKLGISSHEKSFNLRKDTLDDYKETFNEMIQDHMLYLKDIEIFKMIDEELNTLNNDIASYRDDLSSSKRKHERLLNSIQTIQSQLDQIGYQDIRNRLEIIEETLTQLSNDEKHNIKVSGELENAILNLDEKIKELKISFETQSKRYRETQDIFNQECNLHYVSLEEKNPKVLKKLINETYPSLKAMHDLGFSLQDVIHINRGSLQEYNLTRYNIFKENKDAERLEITARYAGQNINIKKLYEYLSDAIHEQKDLLEQRDRELIEEILINTISKKIRNKIQHSSEWVMRINRYMNGMNTSSGLKLSLNWQSKKGETEDELNSEKLVALMQRDVAMLKDSDLKALSKHFESKINLARKKSDLEETQESFHQIMRDIMDFRTWFTFKIMFQKQGEHKKELTNNIFNTFSGGEKAMSMYIPLFSALAAKYEGARDDAPNIIALDEAFAGVDENNIENMFDLIRKFKFDYIMNSQVLWGDYPSVKALAIYELFRPDNAKFITIVGYDWNGKTKRLTV